MKSKIIIKEIDFPELEKPLERPVFTEDTYQRRINRLKDIMAKRSLDHIVVYGDMSNFSNINYLTGINLKFEQGLLVLNLSGTHFFISGNEMLSFCKASPYKKLNLVLFQPFSLQGQPHSSSIDLKKVFMETGIKEEDMTGIIGNKYYPYYKDSEQIFDIPHYILENLSAITGRENLCNVTQIMTDSVCGMRNNMDAEDIAFLEYSAGISSYGIYNILKNLKPGIDEVEASSLFEYRGELPFFVPWGIEFGYDRLTEIGLPDKGSVLKAGDKLVTGTALWGSCIARSGIAVENRDGLESIYPEIIDRFYIPYFKSIVNWYQTVKIGMTGGELYRSVADFVEDPDFGVDLNPGHLIHYDEWTNSPIYRFSREILHSGMAIQCDYFSHYRKYGTDLILEDGLILAGDRLKADIERKYPGFMKRVEKRRKFISGTLGIELDKSVLPLNDIQAILPPYLLNINNIMAAE